MQELEKAILDKGTVLPGNILKVNSFLNHQVDPALMYQVGKEFADYFKEFGITKIITVETSGIAPAVMTGLVMNLPVVFAKKNKSLTVQDNVYAAEVYSYTKQTTNQIYIEKQFLNSTDKVLIIDDFLANGEATKGLINICNQVKASVSGIGIVIEKSFQPGADWLKEHGYQVKSLARIKSLANNKVEFKD
ncbi:xanthine phosphoribosyltransferase [Fructilactobacillus vespulae]|uniref:xanthine phosphoribosyltransferase n=1 Tax=Fructilactobacillus vespulae TaxID=1249630 RepID=UPI0039B558B1